jgi:hypothetical protein
MQQTIFNQETKKPVGTLNVVRCFKRVIESRDINKMTRELYEFLTLHCGFIAHYNIRGFKSTYSPPNEFADVFIRHFDKDHRYFDGIYRCHEEPYKDTGFTKAEIKDEFNRIVEAHKDEIGRWAQRKARSKRYSMYLALKGEFEHRA